MNKFQQLGLSDELQKSIDFLGFEVPTPIQEQAIPILIKGEDDFIGLAQTGTGKTAAFGLPIIDLIDADKSHIQALVLAPTRELGKQIAQQVEIFAKFKKGLKVQVVYGGASIYNQITALKRNPQILIATPGRLLDLIKRKKIYLDKVHTVILDEADEMLSMGFQEDLDSILSHTPDDKKTWLFSATMAKEVRKIVIKYMSDPKEVKVNTTNQVNVDIDHQYVLVKNRDKMETIKRILDVHPDMRGIVFCRTRRDTQAVAERLMESGYKADALHGDLSQAQRDRVMGRFKKHSLQVLVGTDVAARGIDVDNITHVIHHSLPDELAYYTHRSGRTGRAGNKGISISFIPPSGMRKIKQLERSLKITFSKMHIPSNKEVLTFRLHNWAEQMLNSPIDDKIKQESIDDVLSVLEEVSKEDLIKKLIAIELKNLGLSSKGKDLNISESDYQDRSRDRGRRGRDRGRGERRGRRRDDKRSSDRRDRRSDRRDDRRHSDFDRNKGARRDSPRKKDGPNRRERRASLQNQGNFTKEFNSERTSERRTSSPGTKRFFINIGRMDKLNQTKLITYISDNAKIDKNTISNITLRQKHSYFDVKEKQSNLVTTAFKNMEFEGREVRVNRDNG